MEISHIRPDKANYLYDSHSAQWEFYHVLAGKGLVQHAEGQTGVSQVDAFLVKLGEPHQLINDGLEDLILYVVADNPVGESCYCPESGKWLVRSHERRLISSEPLDYFDGEE